MKNGKTERKPYAGSDDRWTQADALFGEVVTPGGFLDRLLRSISRPRKRRWNAYVRACKLIPKDSPVHGTTNFERINGRRHDLINEAFGSGRGGEELDGNPEYVALCRATDNWACGSSAISRFVLGRKLRRLERSGISTGMKFSNVNK